MIDPENNTMRYNLACSLATYAQDKDAAIELLGPYFERVSVSELKHCGADPDMDPLRDRSCRFKENGGRRRCAPFGGYDAAAASDGSAAADRRS